jgi:hypothetical protein
MAAIVSPTAPATTKPGRSGDAAGRLILPCALWFGFTNTKTGPRGRILFDRARDLFIIYADRKLLTPAMIARIETQFHLPADRTEVKSACLYQSTETPRGLGARTCPP